MREPRERKAKLEADFLGHSFRRADCCCCWDEHIWFSEDACDVGGQFYGGCYSSVFRYDVNSGIQNRIHEK